MGSELQSSGSDDHAGIEVHVTPGLARYNRTVPGSRGLDAVLLHSLKMEFDGPLDPTQGLVDRLSRSHGSWQIWDRCSPITVGVLVDAHQVTKLFHDLAPFRPACRLTEASVPLGISSPKLPLTVTRPGFLSCLNWRWLPRVSTWIHPSRSS